jgi:hypothetical protein
MPPGWRHAIRCLYGRALAPTDASALRSDAPAGGIVGQVVQLAGLPPFVEWITRAGRARVRLWRKAAARRAALAGLAPHVFPARQR